MSAANVGSRDSVRVSRRIELRRQMALAADQVTGRAQLQTVRVMAIGAGDTHGEHPALQEGAVLVVLLLDLSVREIDSPGQQARDRAVEQRMAVGEARGNLMPPGMAEPASLNLGIRRARRCARRRPNGQVLHPAPAAAVGQVGNKALAGIVGRRLGFRPGDVTRARAMTGLAGHVDLRPGSAVAVGGDIVVAP